MTENLQGDFHDIVYREQHNGDGVPVRVEEADIIEEVRARLPTPEECNRAKQLLGLAEMAIEKLERALLLEQQLNGPHRRQAWLNYIMSWSGAALIAGGAWMAWPPAAPIVVGVLVLAGVIYSQSGSGGSE